MNITVTVSVISVIISLPSLIISYSQRSINKKSYNLNLFKERYAAWDEFQKNKDIFLFLDSIFLKERKEIIKIAIEKIARNDLSDQTMSIINRKKRDKKIAEIDGTIRTEEEYVEGTLFSYDEIKNEIANHIIKSELTNDRKKEIDDLLICLKRIKFLFNKNSNMNTITDKIIDCIENIDFSYIEYITKYFSYISQKKGEAMISPRKKAFKLLHQAKTFSLKRELDNIYNENEGYDYHFNEINKIMEKNIKIVE